MLGADGRLAIYTPGPALRGTPALPDPIATHSHVYEDEELVTCVQQAGFERVTVTADGGAQLVTALGGQLGRDTKAVESKGEPRSLTAHLGLD